MFTEQSLALRTFTSYKQKSQPQVTAEIVRCPLPKLSQQRFRSYDNSSVFVPGTDWNKHFRVKIPTLTTAFGSALFPPCRWSFGQSNRAASFGVPDPWRKISRYNPPKKREQKIKGVCFVDRQSMSAPSLTRASLLADWHAIGPSQLLSPDLQDLILIYLNRANSNPVSMDQGLSSSRAEESDSSTAPPPQRYQRRRYGLNSRPSKAPSGPSLNIDDCRSILLPAAQLTFDALISSPNGPDQTSSREWTSEMDCVFATIQKRKAYQ